MPSKPLSPYKLTPVPEEEGRRGKWGQWGKPEQRRGEGEYAEFERALRPPVEPDPPSANSGCGSPFSPRRLVIVGLIHGLVALGYCLRD